VNPDDPSEAVINRGLTADMCWGLFPLPFLAVGVGGLLFATGLVGKKNPTVAEFGDEQRALSASRIVESVDEWDDDFELDELPDGPVVLKPKHSPLAKFIGITLMALFWNGITSVFVYKAVESHLDGKPEWCLTFFITPFVLVGLLLIWGIFHSFLSLFIQRPTLTIDRARIPLGGTARLSWKFSGHPPAEGHAARRRVRHVPSRHRHPHRQAHVPQGRGLRDARSAGDSRRRGRDPHPRQVDAFVPVRKQRRQLGDSSRRRDPVAAGCRCRVSHHDHAA
jgi:hypothetical protein